MTVYASSILLAVENRIFYISAGKCGGVGLPDPH